MITVVTGQVGLDKKPFLEEVAELARLNGKKLRIFNVGDMMYAEAPDVTPGRILDLPISRLTSLRRSAFKDIIGSASEGGGSILINTHATFRWRHGLFPAFDHDLMQRLKPTMYVTLVDNVDAVHVRLLREHDINHTLKDLLVWREEEILATEMTASATTGHGGFFVVARGQDEGNARMLYRLLFEPDLKKVYASYPMTMVAAMPEVLGDLMQFRKTLAEAFVLFDPGDLDEKRLHLLAARASAEDRTHVQLKVLGEQLTLYVRDIMEVTRDIDGQIYARDFKMIDQSDMIVSYIPELSDGKPAIASGVERELQHAHESAKQVYVIWRSSAEPSPFVTETANRIFRDLESCMEFFADHGIIRNYQPRLF
jgi:adenylate kinase